MDTVAWYFSAEMRQARAAMLAAHTRLGQVEPRGRSDPDFRTALAAAMRAETAYFAFFHPSSAAESFDRLDAVTSELEGFTPGDTDD